MITLIIPYYNQPEMLRQQMFAWLRYAPNVLESMQFLIVDDGSMVHPALPIVKAHNQLESLNITLLRIKSDIPWNRGGARNLGSMEAVTPWLLHMDIDHVLSDYDAKKLMMSTVNTRQWYRFKRLRVGAADDTRNKDTIPRESTMGEIKPHIDSYLISRQLYWQTGGYDEDYSGCLGGGSPFLKRLTAIIEPQVLSIYLRVYTKHVFSDSSVTTLDRSTDEYTRRRTAKEASGNTKPKNPLRFDWERQL